MVARRGNAPRSAGCKPAALLLSYRALTENWLPNVDSHHDDPLNRRTCSFNIIGDHLLPAGIAPEWFRLETNASDLLGHWSRMKWSRASVPPRVSPRPKRGGFLSPSRTIKLLFEIGGLCGLCSRDLPLDRRLLFVAELTGRKWWVVSVTLRRWSARTSALQAARALYTTTNPGGKLKWWTATALHRALQLRLPCSYRSAFVGVRFRTGHSRLRGE